MVVVITGGSRGLGRAIVEACLQKGWDVAFTWVRDDAAAADTARWAAEHAPGRRCLGYRLDVTDAAMVEQVGDTMLDDFDDAIDAVVCNAGITRDGLALSMSDHDWHAVIDTNLTGAFYVARHFLPAMVARRRGRLVFMGSLAQGGASGQANYAASKAGLVGLTRSLGKEYGSKGVTANLVAPGPIDTDLTRAIMSDAVRDHWLERCPLKRVGLPREVAGVVTFLCSDDAAFINAEVINVTGGLDWAT